VLSLNVNANSKMVGKRVSPIPGEVRCPGDDPASARSHVCLNTTAPQCEGPPNAGPLGGGQYSQRYNDDDAKLALDGIRPRGLGRGTSASPCSVSRDNERLKSGEARCACRCPPARLLRSRATEVAKLAFWGGRRIRGVASAAALRMIGDASTPEEPRSGGGGGCRFVRCYELVTAGAEAISSTGMTRPGTDAVPESCHPRPTWTPTMRSFVRMRRRHHYDPDQPAG